MVQARIAQGGNTTNEDYTYDANGVRTSKTVNGTDVTNYITDNNTEYAKVLEEKDNDGKVKAAYTYGDDLISQVRNGKTLYYVYDGEFSVRQLTDETGKVTDTYTYDAWVLNTLSRIMSGKVPQILFACETYNKIFSTGETLIDAETFAADFLDITQAMDFAKGKPKKGKEF